MGIDVVLKIDLSESTADQIGCLLLHGLTGTHEVLKNLSDYLIQLNIKTLVPLLPGHGSSLCSLKKTRWEAWYQTAEKAYLELRASCQYVFIVGFSMGGALSLLISSRHSPQGLVTLAAPIRLNSALKYLLPGLKYILPYWKKSWQPYYRKQRHFKGGTYDAYPLATVEQLDKMLRMTKKQLHEVQCPILLMHGFGDKRVSFHNASIINSLVASTDKRMIFINENRHTITDGEHAPEVFKAVSDFILDPKNRKVN